MNPTIRTIDRRIDFDVMFLRFAELYEHDTEAAYRLLQLLFLDESSCLGRIVFLSEIAKQMRSADAQPGDNADTQLAASDETQLAADTGSKVVKLEESERGQQLARDYDMISKATKEDDFTKEIGIIAECGPVPAIEQGLIAPERMHALTCDPDALRRAFEALSNQLIEPDDPQTDTSVVAVTASDTKVESDACLTPLVLSASEDAESKAQLQRLVTLIVPALLGHLEWAERLTEPLIDFILRRSEGLKARFRDVVSQWLGDFARDHSLQFTIESLSQEDWLAIVRRAAIHAALDAAIDAATHPNQPQPPEWILEFRRTVLARRFGSLSELLSIRLAQPPTGLDIFRREIFATACSEEKLLRRQLELN